MNILFLFLFQGLGVDTGTIIGILAGVISSSIAVYATVKTSRLKADTAQQEINFKTFEVETVAKQNAVETELSSTQRILESWQGMSSKQAARIEQIEADNKHINAQNNLCEVRCARLEGKVEMLSNMQGITLGKMEIQGDRQDAQNDRQDRQEVRQDTQEQRQNTMSDGMQETDMKADKVAIDANTVEVNKNSDE